MKEWIIVAVMILFGGFMAWTGAWSIRARAQEHGIPLIEAALLRLGDTEPLPKSRFDIWLGFIQQWLAAIFGPVILLFGLAWLADLIGWI